MFLNVCIYIYGAAGSGILVCVGVIVRLKVPACQLIRFLSQLICLVVGYVRGRGLDVVTMQADNTSPPQAFFISTIQFFSNILVMIFCCARTLLLIHSFIVSPLLFWSHQSR